MWGLLPGANVITNNAPEPGYLAIKRLLPAGVMVCNTCDVQWRTDDENCWSCGRRADEEISVAKAGSQITSGMNARFEETA